MKTARNIYKDEVDFAALALQSPDFAKHVKPNGQLDFTDPDAVRQLTKSLLLRDFGLKVDLPEDRLCPPVPNRYNYILWLQDLLDTTGDEYRDRYDPDRDVIGLDIGTGCCSIYPLLGCVSRPRWKFVATDVDEQNIESARRNVQQNKLESRIKVVRTRPEGPLIDLDQTLEVERLDFTMCNPPFYESEQEMIASAEAKQRPPFSLSSVSVLVEKLMECGNHNYAVTEFVQGNKTKRWAIAWSWADRRPEMSVARGITGFPKHLLPFPSEFSFHISDKSIDDVGQKVNTELSSLPIQWHWRPGMAAGVGFAMENVWSRQARRKRRNEDAAVKKDEVDEKKAALGFKVQVKQERASANEVVVQVRWLKGTDTVLFESFCGMLKRKVEER
ncbi:hypothetical protein DTO271G3_6199 [Paecilomyces variotii]|nr:hypothetical protein DTO271G3_6199 [Paecilomyces variotii]